MPLPVRYQVGPGWCTGGSPRQRSGNPSDFGIMASASNYAEEPFSLDSESGFMWPVVQRQSSALLSAHSTASYPKVGPVQPEPAAAVTAEPAARSFPAERREHPRH